MSKLTYDEVTKEIKELSSDYHSKLDETPGRPAFRVMYKGLIVAVVDGTYPYTLYDNVDNFDKLPFSHKLWMILSELSMTPIDKRGTYSHHYEAKLTVSFDSSLDLVKDKDRVMNEVKRHLNDATLDLTVI